MAALSPRHRPVQGENAAVEHSNPSSTPRALGLDAGGTQTRWAVAQADGQVLAEGHVAGFSALQLASGEGRAALHALLLGVAQAGGPVQRVAAGMTGFDAQQSGLVAELIADSLGVEASAVQTLTDIELAFHAAFQPGQGIVVYAGTGSIAAHVDALGAMHRAGGRGAVIDDAGGGHWIAREALRNVWRAEDERPGASQQLALGRALAAQVGGNDWAATRQWVYGATRGELGLLAQAVARAAHEGDADALHILRAAGAELARLALALLKRLGAQPVALAGRVFDLHPLIEDTLRAALPTPPARSTLPAHHAAARIAARGLCP